MDGIREKERKNDGKYRCQSSPWLQRRLSCHYTNSIVRLVFFIQMFVCLTWNSLSCLTFNISNILSTVNIFQAALIRLIGDRKIKTILAGMSRSHRPARNPQICGWLFGKFVTILNGFAKLSTQENDTLSPDLETQAAHPHYCQPSPVLSGHRNILVPRCRTQIYTPPWHAAWEDVNRCVLTRTPRTKNKRLMIWNILTWPKQCSSLLQPAPKQTSYASKIFEQFIWKECVEKLCK